MSLFLRTPILAGKMQLENNLSHMKGKDAMNPYESPEFVDVGRYDYWLAKRATLAFVLVLIVIGTVAILVASIVVDCEGYWGRAAALACAVDGEHNAGAGAVH